MCINLRLEASLSKLSSQVMDSHLLDGDAALTASAQLNFTGQVMIIQTPNFPKPEDVCGVQNSHTQ